MRIAQVTWLTEAVPPKLYGGTERVVSYLTETLLEQGHEVTLFASGDSKTRAQLNAVWPRALRLDSSVRQPFALHMLMLEQVHQLSDEFDVLHFHLDYLPLSLFTRLEQPFVTTLHGRLDLPEFQAIYSAFPSAPLISISDAQRLPLPKANWVSTIYHGLPINQLTPQPQVKPEYLAFLGRISPEKGVDAAIRIAAKSGLPLKIAAKVDNADKEYFDTVIQPLLSQPHVEFIGEINEAQKPAFLSGAKALLFAINWPEPFGLSMIEAMACGTPVIAFNQGSVPEVVDDGITGFIVEDEASAVAAIKRLDELSRTDIRAQFERRFTADIMANHYVDVYATLLQAQSHPYLRQVAAG